VDSLLLIVLSGPIASGKSSVARALAAGLRAQRRAAAVVDLDLLYTMLDEAQPMDNPVAWRRARRAAATLADEFAVAGVELVVIEGTFWTVSEREEFVSRLTTDNRPRFVTLRVSMPEALRRVAADATRRSSRDPAFLASNHASFHATVATLSPAELVVDTTRTTTDQAAAMIMASWSTQPALTD
jgi:predicted kinase